MTLFMSKQIPSEATGLRLHRVAGENLMSCEEVQFQTGYTGVETVLRRAAISGRVEVGGALEHHFADVLDAEGNILETVALDSHSYKALKNHWMPCKVCR